MIRTILTVLLATFARSQDATSKVLEVDPQPRQACFVQFATLTGCVLGADIDACALCLAVSGGKTLFNYDNE